jgi:hypothetical protein
MFRRHSVTDLGGYDARALHVEDYELWLRLASVDNIDTVDSPLTDYRIHSGQVTRTKVIGRRARSLVAASRVRLARHRRESVAMANLRQLVWASRQVVREWGSRSH